MNFPKMNFPNMSRMVVLTTAVFVSGSALAGQHTRSIDGCREAIGAELNVNMAETRFHLKKIKSHSRTRDLKFHVYEGANASRVVVNCKVRSYGEVLALDFKDADLPIAATPSGDRSRS